MFSNIFLTTQVQKLHATKTGFELKRINLPFRKSYKINSCMILITFIS